MSAINPSLSIPKPIKIEVDEFQNMSIEQETNMKIEMKMVNLLRERDGLKKEVDLLERTHSFMVNLVRDRELLKKEVDVLENTQSFTELEKCSLEEKLGRSERRCEELDEKVKKLRRKKMESEKAARFYKSRVDDLEPRLLKVEATLAKVLNVNLANFDKFAAAAIDGNGGIGLPKKGGRMLAYSETEEDGANILFGLKPAESKRPLEYNEVKNPKDRGARYRIGCRCILKTIDVIKENLQKENLELFEQSCFGDMLKINKLKYQGNLLMQLLLHIDMSASQKERLIFKVNNSNMEFGPSDFFRITGLRFGKVEARITTASSIHKDVFQGRSIITMKDIEEAFLNISSCHNGKGELTLKLALLYFLSGTLLTKNKMNVQYLHLIEDLQKFNAFPWGRIAYDLLVSSILSLRLRMDGFEVTHQVARFDIFGFCFALQAWAYEVMPSVAAYCASRVNNFEYITPWILRWSATRIIYSDDLKNFFPLSDKAHLQNNTMGKWDELPTYTIPQVATSLNKAKQKKRKFFCYNYPIMPHAQPSSSAATPPPFSTNAPTCSSHHLTRRLSWADGMLESLPRKLDQPILDIGNDELPRNEFPLVDDEKDVSSPTLIRHSESGSNPISMNKATDKHAKLERSFVETKQARALSETAHDRDASGGLKVYVRRRFKAAAV